MFNASTRLRALTICLALVVVAFVLGWITPVPAAGYQVREQIEHQVRQRLPHWEIAHLAESYESSWVVAVRCGEVQVDFRLLRDARPTGGLPWGDYWILAGDRRSHAHLRRVTQELSGWLIWRGQPGPEERLPCEVATT